MSPVETWCHNLNYYIPDDARETKDFTRENMTRIRKCFFINDFSWFSWFFDRLLSLISPFFPRHMQFDFLQYACGLTVVAMMATIATAAAAGCVFSWIYVNSMWSTFSSFQTWEDLPLPCSSRALSWCSLLSLLGSSDVGKLDIATFLPLPASCSSPVRSIKSLAAKNCITVGKFVQNCLFNFLRFIGTNTHCGKFGKFC